MKKIFPFFKMLFLAPLILYIFNLMAIGLDVFIPINGISIVVIWLLGFPGLLLLIMFYGFIL